MQIILYLGNLFPPNMYFPLPFFTALGGKVRCPNRPSCSDFPWVVFRMKRRRRRRKKGLLLQVSLTLFLLFLLLGCFNPALGDTRPLNASVRVAFFEAV